MFTAHLKPSAWWHFAVMQRRKRTFVKALAKNQCRMTEKRDNSAVRRKCKVSCRLDEGARDRPCARDAGCYIMTVMFQRSTIGLAAFFLLIAAVAINSARAQTVFRWSNDFPRTDFAQR
ncbi:MAG: hypothetical protein ACU0DI_09625, partial [Paracoccaceae bacterium]